ncbi:hypothetical protein GX48_00478 [Paracoccidioides brasiliensis]|nr:hypothetical protein GX48_00478 [Paracoccidioides brasiliensis]
MDLSTLTDLAPQRQTHKKGAFPSPQHETLGNVTSACQVPVCFDDYIGCALICITDKRFVGHRHMDQNLDGNASYEENGRQYHEFRRGIYMYPCDEAEQDRLDIFHRMLLAARRTLHSVPISNALPPMGNLRSGPPSAVDQGPRILDLGCGTGIWALDMAAQYPHAYVLGIDLTAMQPREHPPNCNFLAPRDFESPWSFGEEPWDMIHLQMGCGSVSNWPSLYQKVIQHLRPGTGYFEQVEVDFEPRCHDELPDQPLTRWYKNLKDATNEANRPIAHNRSTTHMLKEAGFVDTKHDMVGLPLNTWPDDKYEKDVGKWHSFAFSKSIYALILAPLFRVKHWTVEEIDSLAQEVRTQLFDKQHRMYNLLHVYTARRPDNPVR